MPGRSANHTSYRRVGLQTLLETWTGLQPSIEWAAVISNDAKVLAMNDDRGFGEDHVLGAGCVDLVEIARGLGELLRLQGLERITAELADGHLIVTEANDFLAVVIADGRVDPAPIAEAASLLTERGRSELNPGLAARLEERLVR